MRLHFCQRLTGDLKVLAHQAKARCGMCNVASPRSLTDGGVNARPTSDIDEALPPPLPPPPAPLDFSEPPPPPSESRSPSISPCCLLRSFCGNQGLPVTICSKHAREREEKEDVGEGEAESTRQQGVCSTRRISTCLQVPNFALLSLAHTNHIFPLLIPIHIALRRGWHCKLLKKDESRRDSGQLFQGRARIDSQPPRGVGGEGG